MPQSSVLFSTWTLSLTSNDDLKLHVGNVGLYTQRGNKERRSMTATVVSSADQTMLLREVLLEGGKEATSYNSW
jgi:hypothetical protein